VTQEDDDKSVAEPVHEAEKMAPASDSNDELPLKPKKVFPLQLTAVMLIIVATWELLIWMI